ncbi:CDI system lipoprotein BcpO [Burkholderia gladioli]
MNLMTINHFMIVMTYDNFLDQPAYYSCGSRPPKSLAGINHEQRARRTEIEVSVRKSTRSIILLIAMSALLAACETVPPNAAPRPPRRPEMEPVLPSWSSEMWVMGYWKWSGSEWLWIPGHLAPKP